MGGTVLCPLARHFILCLVLVQPRKTGKHPDMAEKLFTGMSQNVSDIETRTFTRANTVLHCNILQWDCLPAETRATVYVNFTIWYTHIVEVDEPMVEEQFLTELIPILFMSYCQMRCTTLFS